MTSPPTGGPDPAEDTGSSTTEDFGMSTTTDDDGAGETYVGEGGSCPPDECDPFAQDCDSQHCAWGFSGGFLCTAWLCQDVVDDPIPAGEPCDDDINQDPCEALHMCVDTVDGKGHTCELLCSGSADAPECPEGLECDRVDLTDGIYVCRPAA